MRDYYAEYLQTKNSVNTLDIAVSKVSKEQNITAKQTFDTFDTTIFGISEKNNYELAEIKTNHFHVVLNQLIENGITFDVSAEDSQIIDSAQILKASDRDFLAINNADILCQLQQSLLMKHLFSHSPELLEDFAFDIYEREAIMLGGDYSDSCEIYFEAVRETSQKWFSNLSNNK